METLGVTSLRWLGIERVGGCLFVAYILLAVKGNDKTNLLVKSKSTNFLSKQLNRKEAYYVVISRPIAFSDLTRVKR